MVQERSTERRLEECIRHGIVRMPVLVQVLIDRQHPRIVGAHRQPHGIAASHVAVLPSGMELKLLLVEAMDEVAGAPPGWPPGTPSGQVVEVGWM